MKLLGSAASRLLDREMPADYREEWTAIIGAESHVPNPDIKSALVFRVGAEWLSLSTIVLQEITELPKVHKLPHRRGGILNGLVCVRGELLISIALDVLLRLENSEKNPTDASHGSAKLLICDRKGSRFAFPVSEVSGVRTYAPNELKDVPATLSKAVATYTAGVLHIENKIVGYLDDERLFPFLDKNIA